MLVIQWIWQFHEMLHNIQSSDFYGAVILTSKPMVALSEITIRNYNPLEKPTDQVDQATVGMRVERHES